MATSTVYNNSDGTGSQTTSYSYTWTSTGLVQSETIAAPVSVGVYDVTTLYENEQGKTIWVKGPNGSLQYYAYDLGTGALVRAIQDVNTADTGEFSDLPPGWSTPTGYGSNLLTQYQVDEKGRTTKETDPAGNVTYTVYLDAQHEVRVYPGWNARTDTTTGPTQVSIQDPADAVSETLTMVATPHLTDGAPDGSEAISAVESLTVDVTNAAGQVIAEDQYFSLAGLTFAPGVIGTLGTNYYQTLFAYDSLGRRTRLQSPNGVITRTVENNLGQVLSTWVGTNDTPASGEWSPANNTSPSNMVEISANVYDNGGVGDGLLTQHTDADGNATTYTFSFAGLLLNATVRDPRGAVIRSMSYTYDNLGHLLTQTDGDGNITGYTYDERGQVVTATVRDAQGNLIRSFAYTYDSDGNLLTQTDGDGNQTRFSYDALGDVLTQKVYDATGTLVNMQSWTYDADGNVLTATDGDGNVWAYTYDRAGRVLTQTVRDARHGGP